MNSATSDLGVVIDVNGEIANVELLAEESCEHCAAKIICKPRENDKHNIPALNSINAKIGDKVIVSEVENLFLKLSLIQYGIPLVGFLCGLFCAFWIKPQIYIPQEIAMFLSGIIGLTVSFIIAKYFIQKITLGKSYCFEIIGKASSNC